MIRCRPHRPRVTELSRVSVRLTTVLAPADRVVGGVGVVGAVATMCAAQPRVKAAATICQPMSVRSTVRTMRVAMLRATRQWRVSAAVRRGVRTKGVMRVVVVGSGRHVVKVVAMV